MNLELSNNIKAKAKSLGFFTCGIAEAKPVDDVTAQRVKSWIDKKMYADMNYMSNNLEKRLDPRLLVPGVKSIVSVALNYAPAQYIPESEWQFAAYAYGQDYHEVVKNKLRALALSFGFEEIKMSAFPSVSTDHVHFRVFCDTAPVLERYWATQAGLGFIGKNQQLIIPKAGSMFFLGELFLDITLEYDMPMQRFCGRCTACIDACPSGALSKDNSLDANKCLSYQTIENRGEITDEVAEQMGNTVYGCDKCLQACPWNRFSHPTNVEEFAPKPEFLSMTKKQWLNLSEEDYHRIFKGSAVKRAKYCGLMRNIMAIAKNETKKIVSESNKGRNRS